MPKKVEPLERIDSLEYVLKASPVMLHNFIMSRMSHVANMEKHVRELLDQIVTESSEAMLARLLMEHRSEIRRGVSRVALEGDSLFLPQDKNDKLLQGGNGK